MAMDAPGLQIGSTVTLANGVEMPMLGLGVWQAGEGAETQRAVAAAIEIGYRHVDTARAYRNEADVGAALRESGLPRGKLFVTTKLWNTDHGYDRALRAIDKSLASLGLEQVDLYLVHWPVAGRRGETWRAMERILADGKARAIGVSNYTIAHLEELVATATVPPAVNQVEFNPFLHQRELLAFCRRHSIQLEAYAPLVRGQRMGHPVVLRIAERHQRTPGQVLLRWGLQHRLVVIPKSVRPDRIRENADLYGFALDAGDMDELDGLDERHRTCWDPTGVP